MKPNFLLFIIVLFGLNCKKDASINTLTVRGHVLSEITNKPFPNSKVFITVYKTVYFGYMPLTASIDHKNTITDSLGNFTSDIIIDNDSSTVIRFEKIADKQSGDLVKNAEFSFLLFRQNPITNLYVRQYADLIINLKNVIPFDNNDQVSISYFVTGSSLSHDPVDSVINYGLINQPYLPPAYNDGKNLFWIGKDVNSTIAIKVQESTTFQIFWTAKKNNIITSYKSQIFNTSINSVNKFEINY